MTTILIAGSTDGIGLATAKHLAALDPAKNWAVVKAIETIIAAHH